MYTTFEDRVNAMDLDDAVKKDLIAKNKEILDTSFFPAYEELKKNIAKKTERDKQRHIQNKKL